VRLRTLVTAAIVVLAVFVAAGCGGDDEGDGGDGASTTPPTSQAPAAGGELTIRMSEFAFDPKDAVAKAGSVVITAPNDGKVIHELVVLKTDADPAELPKKGGQVDESTAVGEIADVEPGATGKKTFEMKAGKYALVCALPGHYEGGMYGSLTVD
jgi:uncharacterized cupredoxin-like copper-binding protein